MFEGAAEMGAGGGIAYGSGGLAASVGLAVFAHGADHFVTGMRTIITGRYGETATSQLLQKTGMSMQTANLVDSGMSIGGIMGGTAAIRFSRLTAFPHFQLPFNPGTNLGGELLQGTVKLWPSASQGRQFINGIEYSTHALERMSPRGLIQKGTEIISRGVPPSVIENAIKFGVKTPGNTANEIVHTFENVRIVTNPEGTRIITVITTGR